MRVIDRIFVIVLFIICLSCKKQVPIVTDSENDQALRYEENWSLLKEIPIKGYMINGCTSFKHLIFISDSVKSEVVQFTTSGEIEKIFSFKNPQGMRCSGNRILLADAGKDSIWVYRGNEWYPLEVFAQLDQPIAIDGKNINEYAVADRSHRVFFSIRKDSSIILGGKGSDLGMFNNPSNVLFVDSLLYVLDSGNKRVQSFDYSGNVVSVFGQSEKMEFPTGLDFDDNGNIYVSDMKTNRIYIYNKEGTLLDSITSFLDGPIAINYLNSLLYVANKESATIAILKKD